MTFDAQNFDAVVICYLAAVAAGSTEGADMAASIQSVSRPPGDQYTWEELPEAIEALQNGDDIDYQGASGAIDMDDAGDRDRGRLRHLRVRGQGSSAPIGRGRGGDAEES